MAEEEHTRLWLTLRGWRCGPQARSCTRDTALGLRLQVQLSPLAPPSPPVAPEETVLGQSIVWTVGQWLRCHD